MDLTIYHFIVVSHSIFCDDHRDLWIKTLQIHQKIIDGTWIDLHAPGGLLHLAVFSEAEPVSNLEFGLLAITGVIDTQIGLRAVCRFRNITVVGIDTKVVNTSICKYGGIFFFHIRKIIAILFQLIHKILRISTFDAYVIDAEVKEQISHVGCFSVCLIVSQNCDRITVADQTNHSWEL